MSGIGEARGPLSRFAEGVGFLGRGLARWGTTPRLMLLGAIPVLIVGAIYVAGLIALAVNLHGIIVWSTPFAGSWLEPWQTLFRIVVGVAFVGFAVVIIVFTFTALTLAVGDPFYERIWRAVEQHAGGLPPGAPRSWASSVVDGVRLLLAAGAMGVLLFVCGFIPVVGQVLVIISTALIAGWFLAVELTARALDWRGLSLTQRRRLLRGNRAGAIGFGVATYLLFLLPLGAVVVMPAALAGATLLARSTLDRSVQGHSTQGHSTQAKSGPPPTNWGLPSQPNQS